MVLGNKPLVTIGMPIFNGEKYIRRSLDSLLAQKYENIELIISDNCSNDSTPKILKEYLQDNECIKIIRNSRNIGAHKNFVKVLEHANGRYFMWAAVDDYWLPLFVSRLVEELERYPQAGVAMCAVERIRTDGSKYDTIKFPGSKNPNRKSFIGMAIALTSKQKYNLFIYGLFRTAYLKSSVSQFLAVPSGERWFLMQFALTYRFRYVEQVLHLRTAHLNPYHDRHPEDDFGRKKQKYFNKRFDFRHVHYAFKVLTQSQLITRYKQIYIPLILTSLIYWRIYNGLYDLVRTCIGRSFPKSIKEIIKKVMWRNQDKLNQSKVADK